VKRVIWLLILVAPKSLVLGSWQEPPGCMAAWNRRKLPPAEGAKCLGGLASSLTPSDISIIPSERDAPWPDYRAPLKDSKPRHSHTGVKFPGHGHEPLGYTLKPYPNHSFALKYMLEYINFLHFYFCREAISGIWVQSVRSLGSPPEVFKIIIASKCGTSFPHLASGNNEIYFSKLLEEWNETMSSKGQTWFSAIPESLLQERCWPLPLKIHHRFIAVWFTYHKTYSL
jgi:hypothetical protein